MNSLILKETQAMNMLRTQRRIINMIQVVDLSKYINLEDRYLSGRDEGNHFRNMLQKHKIDFNESIEIKIPKRIIGINMSFFLGMFDEKIGKFNSREELENKIKFTIENEKYRKQIEEDIDTAISEILDNQSIEELNI